MWKWIELCVKSCRFKFPKKRIESGCLRTNHVKRTTIGRNIFSRRYFYSSRVDYKLATKSWWMGTKGWAPGLFLSSRVLRSHLAQLTPPDSILFCLLEKSKEANSKIWLLLSWEITCLWNLGGTRKQIISVNYYDRGEHVTQLVIKLGCFFYDEGFLGK